VLFSSAVSAAAPIGRQPPGTVKLTCLAGSDTLVSWDAAHPLSPAPRSSAHPQARHAGMRRVLLATL